ncbi:hypothetical protein Y032_0370g100 [Ancylostoma ceylanicum]|uniref:Uncharacterized protein n=1 Tax=Ancylostoma ceylanicum TaxID=53326 RepID=A0A016RUG2_9BILA|nr:hypothetical protein Y032_0370g100 [Ancylostoma ceylanicum]
MSILSISSTYDVSILLILSTFTKVASPLTNSLKHCKEGFLRMLNTNTVALWHYNFDFIGFLLLRLYRLV